MKLTAYLLIGVTAIASLQTWRLASEQRSHAETRTSHAQYRADIERQRAEASEQARQKEQELSHAATQAQAQADALREQLDRDRDLARASSQRLRDAAATAALVADSQCQAATSAAVGKTAESAARVLERVLGELDQRAGAVESFADASRVAGLQCEAIHDAGVKATR